MNQNYMKVYLTVTMFTAMCFNGFANVAENIQNTPPPPTPPPGLPIDNTLTILAIGAVGIAYTAYKKMEKSNTCVKK